MQLPAVRILLLQTLVTFVIGLVDLPRSLLASLIAIVHILSNLITDWTRAHPLREGTATPTALRKSCIFFQRYSVDSSIRVRVEMKQC
jgi:hypothetical protein